MARPRRENRGYRLFKTTYRDRRGNTRHAAKWYIELRDHNETVRRVPAFTSKPASDELGRNIVKLIAFHRASGGQIDPGLSTWLTELPLRVSQKLVEIGLIEAERLAASQPLSDHVADFRAKMIADDCGSQHVHDTIRFIEVIIQSCGFRYANDINTDAVNRFVVDLRSSGKSIRRINAFLTAAKSFTRWLTTHGKLPSDPLTSVKKGNVKTDRRYERRPLTVYEFQWLMRTTYSGPTRYNMTGPQRALLYCVAVQTGLRSGELRSLTTGMCHLHRDLPSVTCQAKASKNSKDAHQHIKPETAQELQEMIATKSPTTQVFKMPHESKVAEMLRADLGDARQAWMKETVCDLDEQARRRESDFLVHKDAQGRRLDFHALRYTTGAWLAMAGVHPKKIQRIMRHSSITLTMDTYGHLFPGEEAETVNHFPNMAVTPVDTAQATGTFDPSGQQSVLAFCLAQKERFREPQGDSGGHITQSREKSGIRRKSSISDVFDASTRRSNNEAIVSAACPSGLRGRIANPFCRGFESHRGLLRSI